MKNSVTENIPRQIYIALAERLIYPSPNFSVMTTAACKSSNAAVL